MVHTVTGASTTSFSLNAYFTSGGAILGTHSGTGLTAADATGTPMFHSDGLLFVNPMVGSFTKIEMLWSKPAGAAAGTLASASPLPLIGSLVTL